MTRWLADCDQETNIQQYALGPAVSKTRLYHMLYLIISNIGSVCMYFFYSVCICGSVAEWLACWTQAQKGPGSDRSRDAVG